MPRKIPLLVWLALPLAYFLYFYRLGATGVLGPDEPRYASVAREMARSGDWITPRLWGAPWFEKPPLLYWMTGAAFRAGIGPDMAPRLPVALLAVGFLAFFWWILNREYGGRVAWLGVLILGTTVGWQGGGQAGVTDLPLAATFGGAMLLALPWVARDDTRYLPAAAALMGLAVLAKGPLPIVLALPVALRGRRLQDLARVRVMGPFLAVSVPWYLLCYLKNGNLFLKVFLIRHNWQRFTSSETILHGQPWWFYVPVLLAGLIPWAPLVALSLRRPTVRDRRKAFLLAWVVWGIAFFSMAANKLPAYILPLLPACAVLMAVGLDELAGSRPWLAVCALLLVAFPMAAPLVPGALELGLSRSIRPVFEIAWLAPLGVAAAVWCLESRGRRMAAAACLAVGVGAGAVYVKESAVPALERMPSPRALWRQVAPHAHDVCMDHVHRNWQYGLNYYAGEALPECSERAAPWQVRQAAGQLPRLVAPPPVAAPPEAEAAVRRGTVDPAMRGIVLSRIRE
jgi:4-amino-4-deoxy-L-arabinose transferase-like glycosyltransferase